MLTNSFAKYTTNTARGRSRYSQLFGAYTEVWLISPLCLGLRRRHLSFRAFGSRKTSDIKARGLVFIFCNNEANQGPENGRMGNRSSHVLPALEGSSTYRLRLLMKRVSLFQTVLLDFS